MNKIVKLALVLFLICAIAAGVLGGVNEITKDKIAYQNYLKKVNAYNAVLQADSYDDLELSDSFKAQFPTIDTVSEAAGGKGWVVVSTFSGAQGSITMACGVDKDYKCTGISIISHSETSGLGAVAASTSEKGQNFRAQFVGQGENIALAKKGGEIDAITGATITSTAVTNATAESIKAVKTLG